MYELAQHPPAFEGEQIPFLVREAVSPRVEPRADAGKLLADQLFLGCRSLVFARGENGGWDSRAAMADSMKARIGFVSQVLP